MILGKVIGNVVSTAKNSHYIGEKILMVKPVDPKYKINGTVLLAIDRVQAGIDDIVLVLIEGNSARQIFNCQTTPVNSVIVGIVDEVENANAKR